VIGRPEIVQRSLEWGLREDVVEKDYVLGWVLWGIGSDPVLRLRRLWLDPLRSRIDRLLIGSPVRTTTRNVGNGQPGTFEHPFQ
jgi:hypothetical protein